MIKPPALQIACSVRHGRHANLPGLPTISAGLRAFFFDLAYHSS
jgi:hypothetical protein